MIGRRLASTPEEYPYQIEPRLQPGDYAHCPALLDFWILRAPNGDYGSLDPKRHTITEHADGTISVSPSIQFQTGQRWHGYLEKGVWRSC